MGDFNLDLIKTDSNNESNLFYNNLSSSIKLLDGNNNLITDPKKNL